MTVPLVDAPPPVFDLSKATPEFQELIDNLYERVKQRGIDATAQYLATAGIFFTTIGLRYDRHKGELGRVYRRVEVSGGKRLTVSYDYASRACAVNGKQRKGAVL